MGVCGASESVAETDGEILTGIGFGVAVTGATVDGVVASATAGYARSALLGGGVAITGAAVCSVFTANADFDALVGAADTIFVAVFVTAIGVVGTGFTVDGAEFGTTDSVGVTIALATLVVFVTDFALIGALTAGAHQSSVGVGNAQASTALVAEGTGLAEVDAFVGVFIGSAVSSTTGDAGAGHLTLATTIMSSVGLKDAGDGANFAGGLGPGDGPAAANASLFVEDIADSRYSVTVRVAVICTLATAGVEAAIGVLATDFTANAASSKVLAAGKSASGAVVAREGAAITGADLSDDFAT